MDETERLIRILEQGNPAALWDNAEELATKMRTLHAFWKVVDSYLARGGDAPDYLPLDILAAWQNVITGKEEQPPKPITAAAVLLHCVRCGAELDNVAPGFSATADGLVCTACLRPGEELARGKSL